MAVATDWEGSLNKVFTKPDGDDSGDECWGFSTSEGGNGGDETWFYKYDGREWASWYKHMVMWGAA